MCSSGATYLHVGCAVSLNWHYEHPAWRAGLVKSRNRFFFVCVQCVKVRGDCSFWWFWWNWWPSLFKTCSCHNIVGKKPYLALTNDHTQVPWNIPSSFAESFLINIYCFQFKNGYEVPLFNRSIVFSVCDPIHQK